jgi:hypothetical protein
MTHLELKSAAPPPERFSVGLGHHPTHFCRSHTKAIEALKSNMKLDGGGLAIQ